MASATLKLEAAPSLGPSGEFEFDNINLADLLAFDGSPSGGLDALTLPESPDGLGTSAFQPSDERPSCSFGRDEQTEALASNFETTEDFQAENCGTTQSTKRRRRVRNAKQQELNRLAQQRYRQRKKQVFSSLQTTVTGLSEQLGSVSVLERENIDLKHTNEQLTQQLAAKDAVLHATQQQLASQAQQLGAHEALKARQERKLFEQQVVIETQQQQLKQVGLPAVVDPVLMSERILQVVQLALADAAAQQGVPLTISADILVQHLSRSLSSCCRDLYYPGKAPAASEAPAITVSCC